MANKKPSTHARRGVPSAHGPGWLPEQQPPEPQTWVHPNAARRRHELKQRLISGALLTVLTVLTLLVLGSWIVDADPAGRTQITPEAQVEVKPVERYIEAEPSFELHAPADSEVWA